LSRDNCPETQLVHEIANAAWRLNRIPLLEAELLYQDPNPQTLIPTLATLGLHGSRLSRQFQKGLEQLRDIQDAQRVRRTPPTEPGSCLRRTPFCATTQKPAAWNAANSPKPPISSCAINTKDFPGTRRLSQRKLASFFQKINSSATLDS
jgi:hypothetical protein